MITSMIIMFVILGIPVIIMNSMFIMICITGPKHLHPKGKNPKPH